MNTFFRGTIYFVIALLVFTLSINFVSSLNAFEYEEEAGINISSSDEVLSTVTGLDDPNMNNIFLIASGGAALAAIGLGFLTHSIAPVGIYLYGQVFWTAWLRMWSVITFDVIPMEFILLFTAAVLMLFVASIIGMLTGSG